jgi:hypothetical protein
MRNNERLNPAGYELDKKKHKIMAGVLAAALTLSLSGCGGEKTSSAPSGGEAAPGVEESVGQSTAEEPVSPEVGRGDIWVNPDNTFSTPEELKEELKAVELLPSGATLWRDYGQEWSDEEYSAALYKVTMQAEYLLGNDLEYREAKNVHYTIPDDAYRIRNYIIEPSGPLIIWSLEKVQYDPSAADELCRLAQYVNKTVINANRDPNDYDVVPWSGAKIIDDEGAYYGCDYAYDRAHGYVPADEDQWIKISANDSGIGFERSKGAYQKIATKN